MTTTYSDCSSSITTKKKPVSDHQCSEKVNSLNGFTLRMWNFVSSSWFERLRISDRKFVNHTTEMILWSMILKKNWVFGGLVITYAGTSPFLFCPFLKEIDKSITITGLSKHLELRVALLTSFSKYANTQLYYNNLKGTLGLNSFVYHYRHLLLGKSKKVESEKKSEANSTQCSQAVTHPSTD